MLHTMLASLDAWLPFIIDRLLDWFPMLLLIAVWLIFLRKMGGPKNFQADILVEYRKQTAVLERIAAALEKRG